MKRCVSRNEERSWGVAAGATHARGNLRGDFVGDILIRWCNAPVMLGNWLNVFALGRINRSDALARLLAQQLVQLTPLLDPIASTAMGSAACEFRARCLSHLRSIVSPMVEIEEKWRS